MGNRSWAAGWYGCRWTAILVACNYVSQITIHVNLPRLIKRRWKQCLCSQDLKRGFRHAVMLTGKWIRRSGPLQRLLGLQETACSPTRPALCETSPAVWEMLLILYPQLEGQSEKHPVMLQKHHEPRLSVSIHCHWGVLQIFVHLFRLPFKSLGSVWFIFIQR